MDAGVLGRRQRGALRDRYESLDPYELKRELERGLQPILARAVTRATACRGELPQGD